MRSLGQSGLRVSVAGLGTNNLGLGLTESESQEVVHAALDAGITFFDTSDNYGDSEEKLGRLLAGVRDDVVIATKFGTDIRSQAESNGQDWDARGSRRYIMRAVERSLRRLKTDWIDLYQIHHPDPHTPVDETLSALSDLVTAGKVRYIGSSNFAAWQVSDADWTSSTSGHARFITSQNEYNLVNRRGREELIPAVQRHGLSLLPYYPLASGLLTGKYRRGTQAMAGGRIQSWGMEDLLTDPVFDRLEALETFARQHGVEIIDVALGGLAAEPFVGSVIAGATSPEQVKRNVQAVAWHPGPMAMADLDGLLRSLDAGV